MVSRGGRDILPRARKTQALLAYLCLAEGARVSRNRLAGLLWDRSPDIQARASVRHALMELNRAIKAADSDLLGVDRESVRLDLGAIWVDALAEPDDPERLLEDLYGVSTSFDHWLSAERARFEDRVRSNFERALGRLLETDATPDARVAAARKLVALDPTNERAVRNLMTALVQLGDRPGAIREFERCRQALHDRLDLAPSQETVALHDAIRLASAAMRRPAPAGAPPFDVDGTWMLAGRAPHLAPRGMAHRPAVAVLPFRELSTDRAYQCAGAGLAEDVIHILSRVPELSIISRLSTLASSSQGRTPHEIGEALGAEYVLSGSVRAAGFRLRLTLELTDGRTGVVLWSSALDERFRDLLDMQRRLAEKIVRLVVPVINLAELRRARIKPPEKCEAYDLFLCARQNMHNFSPAIFGSSEALFDRALERDPHCGAALAWRAYWHLLRLGQGWSADPAYDLDQADYFSRLAVERDASDPLVHAVKGHVSAYLSRNFEAAFESFDAAVQGDPNLAPAWLWSAAASAYTGQGRRAVEEIERALSLAAPGPLMYAYSSIASLAYLTNGQLDRAADFALRSVQENKAYTTAQKLVVMSLGMAGRESEARGSVEELLRLEPRFTVEQFRERSPTNGSSLGAAYCDALARAGLPPF
jgi:TolB-like protein/DNA-binding SARP family transcriptional activator